MAPDPQIQGDIQRRVEGLQLRYVHDIDDGNLDTLPDYFTEKCYYRLTSRENWDTGSDLGVIRCESRGMLRDRITASREASVFAPRYIKHILGGSLIGAVKDNAVSAVTNVAIYQTSADGDTLLLMAGVYRDVIDMTGDEPRFTEKQLVYDTIRLPDSVVGPL